MMLSGGVADGLELLDSLRDRAPGSRIDVDDLSVTWLGEEIRLSGWLRPGTGAVLPLEGEFIGSFRGQEHRVSLLEIDGRATLNGADLASWLAEFGFQPCYGE